MARAACAGMWELFDSTHQGDHHRAKAICLTCPLLAACTTRTDLERERCRKTGQTLVGTWSGRLYGSRHDPLADSFPDHEVNEAHAHFLSGVRTPTVEFLERVYQQRSKAARRELVAS